MGVSQENRIRTPLSTKREFSLVCAFASTRAALIGAMTIVCAVFVATRMQYWVVPPIPIYYPDSETYFAIAFDIAQGRLPTFDIRTPAYPIFLCVALAITDSVRAVLVAQQLFTLAAALSLCLGLYLARPWSALPALLPCVAIVGSRQAQMYELYMTADSMYANALIAAVASLMPGLVRRSTPWLVVASIVMGAAVLLKPAGLFLAGTYLLVLAVLLIGRFERGALVGFALPFPAMLFALCVYNYVTLGKFTVSPFGPANLAGATATYWREMPEFPEPVNRAVRQVQDAVTESERAVLRSSWDPWHLHEIYDRHYNQALWYTIIPALDAAGIKGMNAQARELGVLSRFAISSDPRAYAKYVYTSLRMQLIGVARYEWPDQESDYRKMYGPIPYLSDGIHAGYRSQLPRFEDPDTLTAFRAYVLREFALQPESRPVSSQRLPPGPDAIEPALQELFWPRLAVVYDRYVHRPLYVSGVWVLFPFLLLACATVVFMGKRSADAQVVAAVCMIVPLSLIGAMVLIALVEQGLDRYVYPTRFLFYLAPVLLLWLIGSFLPSGANPTVRGR